MADATFPSFLAGIFDLSKAAKFGWTLPKDMPSFGAFSLTGPSDPYAALRAKYPRNQLDVTKLDKESQGIGALVQSFYQDPILLSELKKIDAQEANKMSRENLKLAEEAAVRQQGRDFTFGQASSLLSAIPQAFSPIPFDKTQEVVANIANITSPKNITSIPQVTPAGFSYTPTKYFR